MCGTIRLRIRLRKLVSWHAITSYTSVRIKLAWLIKQLIRKVTVREPEASIDSGDAIWDRLKRARQALQSLEYFHMGRPKTCGKIMTLFPLEAAWSFISEVHVEGGIDVRREHQWCLATAHRLSSAGFVIFRWR